ncbi:MAG: DinB family protein [Chloroflexi bacterium]|nr:DinB family protein [Chloroflexota bacterium]
MEPQELVVQIFERIWSVTDSALDGLTNDELTVRPAPDSNSMGWIAWHLTRVEDRWFHSIAGGADEVWRRGWAVRLGMGDLLDTTGGGMPKEQVDAFNTPTLEQLQGYQAAVRQETKAYLSSLSSEASIERSKRGLVVQCPSAKCSPTSHASSTSMSDNFRISKGTFEAI